MKNTKFLALCAVVAVASLSHTQDAAAFGFNPMNILTGMAQNQAQNQIQNQVQQRQQPQAQQRNQNQEGEILEQTTTRRINGKIVTTTTRPGGNNPANAGVAQQRNAKATPGVVVSQPTGYQQPEQPSNGQQFLNAGGDMVNAGGRMVGSAVDTTIDTTKSLFNKIQNIRLPEGQPQSARDPNMMP